MGAFPLGLCEVSAAEFSRMGGTLDCAVGVGPRLLPAAAGAGPGPPCCGASPGLQMDSNRFSLLARSRSIRREQVLGGIGQTRLAVELGSPRSYCNNSVNLLWIPSGCGTRARKKMLDTLTQMSDFIMPEPQSLCVGL